VPGLSANILDKAEKARSQENFACEGTPSSRNWGLVMQKYQGTSKGMDGD